MVAFYRILTNIAEATEPLMEEQDLDALTRKLPDIVVGNIDGRELQPDGSFLMDVVNPDTGETLVKLAETDQVDVNLAVQSAYETFHGGAWSRASVSERQDVMRRAAALIRERADELAAMDTLTTGLSFHRSTRGQAAAAAQWFEYYAALIGTMDEKLFRQLPQTWTLATRDPVGVAGIFTPWNIPFVSACAKSAAALAMGNSCVVKPSEQSPLASLQLARILHEAGLPRGAFHVVNGRGETTGAALAQHPNVAAISFTGGEHAGRAITVAAAQRFAKVCMELGGKSANIVFADADYDRALDGSIQAIFANNGQACLAGSRIFVEKSIADRFIADFIDRAKNIQLGRPFDPNAEMGPQSSFRQMERVLSFAGIAEEDGGDILFNAGRREQFGAGCYIGPIVALAHDHRSRICQEEIFGPFATFLIFETEDEAIEKANDTRFGLAAYLWTDNVHRAQRVSSRLRSGTVLVNTAMVRELNAPFGGFGHSGLDREGGRWSLNFYSEAKTIVSAHS